MRACIVLTMAIALAACASPAWAQGPSTPQPSPNPIEVERVENQFVVSPDYKFTWFGHEDGQLAGFTAGYQIEDTFFIGGAGYWQVAGAPDWDLAYGGLLVGVRIPAANRIAFGVKGLVGVGEATVRATYHNAVYPIPVDRGGRWHMSGGTPSVTTGDVRVAYDDTFFVFEPAGEVQVTITRHIRFGVAGGYRVTSGHYAPNGDNLDGATVTASVQVGLGGK